MSADSLDGTNHVSNLSQPRKRALLTDEKAREIFKRRLVSADEESGSETSLFTARSILISKVLPTFMIK